MFLFAVNNSDNKKQPERRLHGENWPDGPSLISIYHKNYLDFFIFVIFNELFGLYSFILASCHFFCMFVCACVFSATGVIQETVVHTVLNEQKASVF